MREFVANDAWQQAGIDRRPIWSWHRVCHRETRAADVSLWVVREVEDDLNKLAPGNKHYKLIDNLRQARAQGFRGVAAFGGRWSNLIHSLARSAPAFNLASCGFIRGLEQQGLTRMLLQAEQNGMQLIPVSYADYRQRHNPEWLSQLQGRFPDFLILPEGGSNMSAVKACQQFFDFKGAEEHGISHLAVAVGTGATATGIASALPLNIKLEGYAVVNDSHRARQMQSWMRELGSDEPVTLLDAVKPGYAKLDPAMCHTVDRVNESGGVLLDPVYGVKAAHGVLKRIEAGCYEKGASVALLHTGGLQGWQGISQTQINLLSACTRAAVQQCTCQVL